MKKILTIILLFIILPSSIFVGIRIYDIYKPNSKTQDFFEINNLKYGNINIILGDKIIESENSLILQGDNIYLPLDFVKEYVDKAIFWDESSQILTITTQTRLLRMIPNDLNYLLNMQPKTLDLPILHINQVVYMPLSFVEDFYDITFLYIEENNIIIADYTATEITKKRILTKTAQVRFEPNNKSYIAQTLEEGDLVVIHEELEDYTKIRTESGVLGYVLNKSIDFDFSVITKAYTKYTPLNQIYEHKPLNGPVNLVWDLITQPSANYRESSRVSHNGLNVLSPTWFSFDLDTNNADIKSIASREYVDWAHSEGYQVWALLSDNYDDPALISLNQTISGMFLSDTNKRQHVINQLLDYVELYNLDGINIDFEKVWVSDIGHFHQFLRELSPIFKERGIWLSVDVFVPADWSMYYNRKLIGELSDFVIVMSYDDYLGTGLIGPNASIPFVETAILNMLEEVSSEKIVMGLPFYSRIWIENLETGQITRREVGMTLANRIFAIDNKAEFVWQEELGVYYAEYTDFDNGEKRIHRIWLEDERSIKEKLKLVEKYGLGGVASWYRGLERQEVWDILAESMF